VIAGIGVDLVDLARFERALSRTPVLRDRLFAESERNLPLRSLAGRFAAKEAVIKALGDSTGVRWHDMVIAADEHGSPGVQLGGGAAVLEEARSIRSWHLSITHDSGVAVAMVVAET